PLAQGGQAGLALRQRARAGGRALRALHQLLPPLVQVCGSPAGVGQGAGKGRAGAQAAALDVPVRPGAIWLRLLSYAIEADAPPDPGRISGARLSLRVCEPPRQTTRQSRSDAGCTSA